MSEIRIKLLVIYFLAVFFAYLAKKSTERIANRAIEEQKLSTGIYRFFPIEGNKAVELAKGYIAGAKIVFWFVVIIIPLILLWHVFLGDL